MKSIFSTATLAAALAAVPVATSDPSLPAAATTPKIVISEVGFDPPGPDAGQEWVELAVTGGAAPFTVGGFTLESASGGVLYRFGHTTVTPGETVLVSLGPTRPDLASLDALTSRARVLFAGATTDERLDDQSELIVLRDTLGGIEDAVAFGTDGSALATPLGIEALDTGAWPAGGFVDVGFGSTTAHLPGNSIGRNRYADDTDSVHDWAGNGGPDGVGGSPGGPNNCDVTSVDTMLVAAQTLVNDSFAAFAPHPSEMLRFHVTDGQVGTVVTQAIDANRYRVTAQHFFTVDDTLQGTGPVSWAGSLVHDFEQFAPRAYRVQISGTIASGAGDALTLDYSADRSGYGTEAPREDLSFAAALQLYGTTYPYQSTNTTTSRRTGESEVVLRSERSQSSWATGEASLDVAVEVVRTLVSDTETAYSFQIEGTPLGEAAVALGHVQPPSGRTMLFRGSGSVTCTGINDFENRWESAEYLIDGAVVSRVVESDPLVVTSRRTAGSWGDVTGEFEAVADLPIYAPDGETLVARAGTTMNIAQRLSGGKFVLERAIEQRLDGDVIAQGVGVADPPLQQYNPPKDIVWVHEGYGHEGPHGLSPTAKLVGKIISRAIAVTCGIAVVSAWSTGAFLALETGGGALVVAKYSAMGSAAFCTGAGLLWDSYF
ncbi:MAG: lamin tail domain-containing protein [Planctomycetota bacterium]